MIIKEASKFLNLILRFGILPKEILPEE